jgi:hypothetical protein
MAERWLRQFIETVSACWEWHALALHIGIQYREPEEKDDGWEVWVYPAVQEILGGKHDGETGWCGFNFDLSALSEELEDAHISLNARVGQEPSEALVEGKFRGQEVFLHLCLEPPEGVEATEIIDLTEPGGASVREKG